MGSKCHTGGATSVLIKKYQIEHGGDVSKENDRIHDWPWTKMSHFVLRLLSANDTHCAQFPVHLDLYPAFYTFVKVGEMRREEQLR